MDELGTVLREELARSRPGWPRGAGVIAAASRNGVTAHHAVGTIDDAGTGPDPGTLYRIASISKVFTALALASAVRRGEVELDQPAEGYLPDGFRLPRDGGRPILVE